MAVYTVSSLRSSRARKIVLALSALGVTGTILVLALQGLGLVPVSISSETRGEFTITYWTYDAFGHRGSRKTIYQRRAFWDRHVASDVVSFAIYDKEPGRVFYQICPGPEDPACGTYYYDVQLGRSSKVAGYRLSLSAVEEPAAWSPNGPWGFQIALAGEEEAVIIKLATGATIDVGRKLVLKPPHRRVRFGPWRPDGRGVVAIVTNDLNQGSPYGNTEQDLFVIYPGQEGAIEYIASAAPGWSPVDYTWQKDGLSWTLPPSLGRPASRSADLNGIRRKFPDELPHLRANPDHLTW